MLIVADKTNNRPRRHSTWVRISALLWPLLAFILMPGCAHKSYSLEPLQTELLADQAMQHFDSRTPEDSQLRDWMNRNQIATEPWPPSTWSFEQLVWLAWYRQPALQAASARIAAAERLPVIALQTANPAVRVTREHYRDRDGARLPIGLAIDLDIPVSTGGKRQAAADQASVAVLQAQLDRSELALQLRAQLREQYNEWLATQAERDLDERERKLAHAALALLQQRLSVGVAGSFDVALAQDRVAQVERRLALTTLRSDELLARLAQTCHLPTAQFARLKLADKLADKLTDKQAEELPTLVVESADSHRLRRQALTERIEIKRALANYALAEATLQVEISRQYPDFSLRPGLRWEPSNFIWSIGAALVLPLFNRNEAAIEAAQARRVASAQEFVAVQQRILAQLDTAVARLSQAALDFERSAIHSQASQSRTAAVDKRFERGLADRLDVTLARLEAVTAARWPQQARAEYVRRQAALESTIGFYAGALAQYDSSAVRAINER